MKIVLRDQAWNELAGLPPGAERDLKRLPKGDEQRILDEITALAEEPYPCSHVKQLKEHQSVPVYSHRIGQYRVILTIEDDVVVIFVIEVGSWSRVHRKY